MEEKKRNFFKDIWTSIRDFEEYEEFAADKVSKVVKYLLLLTLIFTIAVSGIYTYKFYTISKDVKQYINDNIEEIKFMDGKLAISPSEPIIIENGELPVSIFIIDTDKWDAYKYKEKYSEKLSLYENGILMLSDRIVILNNLTNQEKYIYYCEIYEDNIPNKEAFMNLISDNNMIFLYLIVFETVFIYLFIVYLASNFVDIVVLGALGYIFARIVRLRLRFKATFNIGVHALTLPVILNLIYITVNTLTGFKINYFGWMYTSISYIYVAVAILMIKAEIINQKIQLMQLQKIQEEAKEELVEEPEEKEEKKDKDKKEEDKKDGKKENDENLGDSEPEGSNA